MEDSAGVCLNLGAGKIKWPGWIGVDLSEHADVKADLGSLPFPDNHADAVAAIHVIEHFYAWEAPVMLKEWLRVLKPGGKLVLELPCMDKVLEHIYQCRKHDVSLSNTMGFFVFWGDPKYKDPLMGHKWGYTKDSMRLTLESVGFRDIEIAEPFYHFPMRDMRITGVK